MQGNRINSMCLFSHKHNGLLITPTVIVDMSRSPRKFSFIDCFLTLIDPMRLWVVLSLLEGAWHLATYVRGLYNKTMYWHTTTRYHLLVILLSSGTTIDTGPLYNQLIFLEITLKIYDFLIFRQGQQLRE